MDPGGITLSVQVLPAVITPEHLLPGDTFYRGEYVRENDRRSVRYHCRGAANQAVASRQQPVFTIQAVKAAGWSGNESGEFGMALDATEPLLLTSRSSWVHDTLTKGWMPRTCRTWRDPAGWERPRDAWAADYLWRRAQRLPLLRGEARPGFLSVAQVAGQPPDFTPDPHYHDCLLRGHVSFGRLDEPARTPWFRCPVPGVSLAEVFWLAWQAADGERVARGLIVCVAPDWWRHVEAILCQPAERTQAEVALLALEWG